MLVFGDSDKGSDDGLIQESPNFPHLTSTTSWNPVLLTGISNASTVVSGRLCVNETVR